MDPENQFFPQTAREEVMVYQILSELERTVDEIPSSRYILFPVSSMEAKHEIRNWIREQYRLLREGYDRRLNDGKYMEQMLI